MRQAESERGTDQSSSGRRHWLRLLGPFCWLLGGFLLAVLVVVDPYGWHAWDDQIRGWGSDSVDGSHEGHRHEAAETKTLWTCGMHPQVLQDEPGQCPICHMDLTPLEREEDNHEVSGERELLFYRHPMDPSVTSPVPAQDEMGMDYLPIYADDAVDSPGQSPQVRIDPGVVQNMNVRTAVARRRDIHHRVRTVGYLEYDQERMVSVTTKYSGWVEKVYVNDIGESVRKGQPLFEVYAPELVQTEQELLSALSFARNMEEAPEATRLRAEGLVEAARERLSYWDVSPRQVAELEASGKVFRTLTVTAPAGGVVMKRMPGLAGMAVTPGMQLFHLADLSSLWLSVEAYENQVAWIREGTPAEISLSYFPGEAFAGRVSFLAPEFSHETRTLPVKIAVPNRDGRLRPGMYATVVFAPVAQAEAVTVPVEAVLRTGEGAVVVVALGEGRFAPRDVRLGEEGEDHVAVLEGIEEGEEVVTSAQFLLDSESSLREAIQKMVAGKEEGR
ncbi:MAG: efflux RND transporter periplasmic adaptor subunit [Deltaproteobacteria bacterium]|nr:efflux RND transporter periplasmic adaptor subunit [Deltaproteobacteria bacterium]